MARSTLLIISTILFITQLNAQIQQAYRPPQRPFQSQRTTSFRQSQYQEPLIEEQPEPLRPKVYEVRSGISPNMGDGSYKYFSETSDGLVQEQQGFVKRPSASSVKEGSYTTFDENGQVVTIDYVADRHGFRPANLPLPPAVPEEPQEIIRAREDILRQQKLIRDQHLAHHRNPSAPFGQL